MDTYFMLISCMKLYHLYIRSCLDYQYSVLHLIATQNHLYIFLIALDQSWLNILNVWCNYSSFIQIVLFTPKNPLIYHLLHNRDADKSFVNIVIPGNNFFYHIRLAVLDTEETFSIIYCTALWERLYKISFV